MLFQRLDLGPLQLLALPFLAGAAVAVITALRRLFAGFTATYLYANGVIHTKNGRIDVVTWPEVDKLMLWEIGGRPERYYVVTHDGRKVLVELESAQGDPTLVNMLHGIVLTSAGRSWRAVRPPVARGGRAGPRRAGRRLPATCPWWTVVRRR